MQKLNYNGFKTRRISFKFYEVNYHLTLCRFFHLIKEKSAFDKHLFDEKNLIKLTNYDSYNKTVLELEKLTF